MMKKAILQLETLACPTCMQKIEGAIKSVAGVYKTNSEGLDQFKAFVDFVNLAD
ncbi:hypothetical protein Si021_00923 [Streptococcus infantarius subsp. infantarius]|nr:hypothetical protein [Streptococcus infantarius subsp. infantarius]MCO4491157.1 hypothetical protein [Streptococcus infantarius subsp. infantarius]MCO4493144.1 hypothetical protein [Streptococcus infantarius subsp. infantarius]MCO4506937.1 hypothetical protein [Streptococcus infantarius subsp. infantarius]MCO4510467.1 hypothetical protein [Streptococcus infantarius subsp. infantarius]